MGLASWPGAPRSPSLPSLMASQPSHEEAREASSPSSGSRVPGDVHRLIRRPAQGQPPHGLPTRADGSPQELQAPALAARAQGATASTAPRPLSSSCPPGPGNVRPWSASAAITRPVHAWFSEGGWLGTQAPARELQARLWVPPPRRPQERRSRRPFQPHSQSDGFTPRATDGSCRLPAQEKCRALFNTH